LYPIAVAGAGEKSFYRSPSPGHGRTRGLRIKRGHKFHSCIDDIEFSQFVDAILALEGVDLHAASTYGKRNWLLLASYPDLLNRNKTIIARTAKVNTRNYPVYNFCGYLGYQQRIPGLHSES
jgi:hypothetical protein